ncbi:class III extradiol ring-cleavage dioxygenase [Sphingobium sp. DEHP117]|uniref:DODA-type extradiol aromatic ring-opening family dioxygenase n=1 Tax=Sphingobium sp. DEHP117 TaxID=2993436 RepID=UPI0027D52CC2|nr:class III extradiol ring-cleavage dioxygenase [Sphingobium sp. DEHP117]MDQ4421598.1 class III extradiol ring-cleavage dioxygenase [Sphingobium sp. DEHP117]
MLRPIFLSHGAPTLPFEDVPARHFLEGLAASIDRPRAILTVSAHWETRLPTVNAVARNATIHDFGGFAPELYQLSYPAPGDPELATRVVELLGDAGLAAATDTARGLDHGAWVPLMIAWPQADIPVVQLSVQRHLGPGHHLEVGRALAPLAHEGVLVVGSGSFTHDLSSWRGQQGMAEPEWVSDFADWFDRALTEQRTCDLLAYRHLAPNAERNHPTEEHLLPLFVALGAAGTDTKATRLHSSTTYGVLRMDAYAFGT